MTDINSPSAAPRRPVRAPTYTSVTSETVKPQIEPVLDADQRVAITVGVADGFRFGCGMLLAGAVFYCGLVVVVAIVIVLATLLGVPLPMGIGSH
jgi:hypothetical protein